MRTHTYWKTYEEYLEWSLNPSKQEGLIREAIPLQKGAYGGVSPVVYV